MCEQPDNETTRQPEAKLGRIMEDWRKINRGNEKERTCDSPVLILRGSPFSATHTSLHAHEQENGKYNRCLAGMLYEI